MRLCGTVAYRLKCSAYNVGSNVSSLVRDSHCVETLNEFFAHNCSSSSDTPAYEPPRRVSALLSLKKEDDIKVRLYCIVLYCITFTSEYYRIYSTISRFMFI